MQKHNTVIESMYMIYVINCIYYTFIMIIIPSTAYYFQAYLKVSKQSL